MAAASSGTVTIQARINTRQVQQALNQLTQQVRATGQTWQNAGQNTNFNMSIQNTTTAASGLGTQMGIVSGVVGSITTALLDMGAAGVQAMADIVAESIALNSEFEQAEIKFSRIFENKGYDKETAKGMSQDFVKTMVGEASRLGQDPTQMITLSVGMLPDVKNVDQFKQMMRVVDAVADDTGRSISDIRMGLERLVSGEIGSGLDWMNMEMVRDDLRAAVAEGEETFTAGLNVIEKKLIETGALALEGGEITFQKSVAGFMGGIKELQVAFGGEIFDDLKEQFENFTGAFGENAVEIEVIVRQAGAILGELVAHIGQMATASQGMIPFDLISSFFSYVQEVIDSFVLLGSVLTTTQGTTDEFFGTFSAAYSALSPVVKIFEGVMNILSRVQEAMLTLSKVVAMSKAGWEGLFAGLQPIADVIGSIATGLAALATGDFATAEAALDQAQNKFNEGLWDMDAAQGAAKKSLRASVAEIDAYEKKLKSNREELEKFNEEANAPPPTLDDEQFSGIYGSGEDEDEDENESMEKRLEAENQFAEKREDAKKDNARKLIDIERDQNDKLEDLDREVANKRIDLQHEANKKQLEAQVENARAREDIARKNADAIEDINRGNADAVEDASKEHSRAQSGMARKQGQARAKLERDAANKRVDIERDYRRSLEQIQNQYNQSAEDAIRSRDAISFVKAQRDMQRGVQDATIQRDQSVEDSEVDTSRAREEMRIQQQAEREEQQIAYSQKLEDLRIQHQRELEEQGIKHQRELEAQDIKEQRAAEDLAMWRTEEEQKLSAHEEEKQAALQLSLERQIEDAQMAHQRKLDDLQMALDEELAMIEDANAKKEELAVEQNDTSDRSQTHSSSANAPIQSLSPTNQMARLPMLAGGGNAVAGRAYLVGEEGPELLTPGFNSSVTSNRDLISALIGAPSLMQAQSSNNRNVNVSIPPERMTPIQQAEVFNMITAAMRSAS